MNLLRPYLEEAPPAPAEPEDAPSPWEDAAAPATTLYQFLAKGNVRTAERVLATEPRQLVAMSEGRWDAEDVDFLKRFVAQKGCTPATTLSELHDAALYFTHVVSTGSEALDRLLDGGMRTEEITELAGPSASGKTQICLSAVASLLVRTESARAVYIDTGNSFSARRLHEICGHRLRGQQSADKASSPRTPEALMSRVRCLKAFEVSQLGDALAEIARAEEAEEAAGPLRLLVLDSASVFGPAVGGWKGHLGFAAMMRVVRMLRTLAIRFGLAVLVVNNVVGEDAGRVRPALGLSWAPVPKMRVLLTPDWRQQSDREAGNASTTVHARLVKSARSALSPPHGPHPVVTVTAAGVL